MKFLRQFLFFLLALLAAATILSLMMPVNQKLERSTTINAPASVIYEQLVKLENFNKWSVWSGQDSSAVFTLTGTDGTIGAATSWKGDPAISGEGKMEIVSLEPNKKVVHKLHFTMPKKSKAESVFTLAENNGVTTVTWNFVMATPRPWNIFNLFYSLDKEMGKDFENGLASLKTAIEKTNGTTSSKEYEVMTMDFPATSFAAISQNVKWSDIPAFFAQHIPIIYSEAAKTNAKPGTPAGLFYIWDEKNQQSNLAAALPVTPGANIENNLIKLVNIHASKAVYVNYYGAYDRELDAYNSIHKYMDDKGLKMRSPIIEQYIAGPANEKDTTKWLTKIVFLVE